MAQGSQLDLVYKAIRAGIFGNIQWKDSAAALVRRNLIGLTPETIRRLLRQHVLDGNELDVRHETRQEILKEGPDDPFWYRAVISVGGLPRGLFVELKLMDDDPEEPFVEIVSAHRQQ